MATSPRSADRDRLEVRCSGGEKRIFEKAATLEGRTLTDFVLAAARSRSKKVIRQAETIVLSSKDFVRILDALDNPPSPNQALLEAAAHYKASV